MAVERSNRSAAREAADDCGAQQSGINLIAKALVSEERCEGRILWSCRYKAWRVHSAGRGGGGGSPSHRHGVSVLGLLGRRVVLNACEGNALAGRHLIASPLRLCDEGRVDFGRTTPLRGCCCCRCLAVWEPTTSSCRQQRLVIGNRRQNRDERNGQQRHSVLISPRPRRCSTAAVVAIRRAVGIVTSTLTPTAHCPLCADAEAFAKEGFKGVGRERQLSSLTDEGPHISFLLLLLLLLASLTFSAVAAVIIIILTSRLPLPQKGSGHPPPQRPAE